MSFSAGEKLGPYEIVSLIGSGGMGEVWKARDTRLGRIVAIKRINGQHSERFEQEARAVAALNLKRSDVVSPVDGIVTNVALEPGDYVTVGKGVMALIDSATLRVEGYFEETKLPRIHVGDRVEVRLMGEQQVLTGHVASIAAGIADRERSDAPDLLANINPTFSWVRLAQRVPVRVRLDDVPSNVDLVLGRTATVAVAPASGQG